MGVAPNAPNVEAIEPECFAEEERQVEHLLRRSQRCDAHSKAFGSASSSDSDLMQARLAALEELTRRFSNLDYRDEWLVAATWLVDRAAIAARSTAVQQDEAKKDALRGELYKSKSFWLGAVLMMAKMLGADTELDCDPKEIMMPLMLDWPNEPRDESDASRTRKERLQRCWNEMVQSEQRICHLLGFDLLVPTPLDLLQALAAVISKAGEGSSWSGFDNGEISVIQGSPGAKKPAKKLAVSRFEALAGLLVELGLLRRPAEVYGSSHNARVLAFAAMRLSLQGFFSEFPDSPLASQAPKSCAIAFARLESRLLSEEEKQLLPSVCAMLHKLWEETETKSCPVMQKWSRRSLGPEVKLLKPTDVAAEALRAHKEPLSQTPPRRQSPPASATPLRLTATRGKKLKAGSPVSKSSAGPKIKPLLTKSRVQTSPSVQQLLVKKQKSEAPAQPRLELAQSFLKRRKAYTLDLEQEQLDDNRSNQDDCCPKQKKSKPADILTRLASCPKNEHSHDRPPCAPLPLLSLGPSPMKPRHRKSPILPILQS